MKHLCTIHNLVPMPHLFYLVFVATLNVNREAKKRRPGNEATPCMQLTYTRPTMHCIPLVVCVFIEVSLSEPHTSKTALRKCIPMYLLACASCGPYTVMNAFKYFTNIDLVHIATNAGIYHDKLVNQQCVNH